MNKSNKLKQGTKRRNKLLNDREFLQDRKN